VWGEIVAADDEGFIRAGQRCHRRTPWAHHSQPAWCGRRTGRTAASYHIRARPSALPHGPRMAGTRLAVPLDRVRATGLT
jgi:hypothetical protein